MPDVFIDFAFFPPLPQWLIERSEFSYSSYNNGSARSKLIVWQYREKVYEEMCLIFHGAKKISPLSGCEAMFAATWNRKFLTNRRPAWGPSLFHFKGKKLIKANRKNCQTKNIAFCKHPRSSWIMLFQETGKQTRLADERRLDLPELH